MKGPIKSALSVALAMAASQAFALGLGPIQIKSGLNQPLLAEIPVVADSAAETEDLRVDLASAEDFQRVGLSRSRVTVPIDFTVSSNSRGQKVIRLTTKEAVREPFLDFLIEASWSKGKLLREYTVLLDPPVTAPAVLATTPKPVEKPKPVEAAPRAPVSQPRAEAPKPVAQAVPAPAPAPAPRPAPVAPPPAPSAAPAAHAAGTSYTVQRGDTLSQIASEYGDDPKDYNRMLLALYKANPEAFAGNMNALKTGAVMRIPSSDEVRASGSLREAAAAVRAQYQSWQGSGTATLVANTGAAPAAEKSAPAPAPQKNGSERLALVPPTGVGSETGTSHGGSGSGSKDAVALRADLARTKEALTSREQEAGELKSRVNQLEDINNKSQRLISLKDSEIAELQNKLKQLDAAKTGAKPAETAAAPTAKPEATAPTPAAAPVAPPPAPATPAPAPVASTPAPAPTPATPPATPPATAQQPSTPAAAPAPATPSPAPAAAPAAPKPPAATAAKPATPAAKGEKPWYSDYVGDNPYLLYGAGGILVLIAGWLFTRVVGTKKTNPRPARAAVAAAAADEIGEDQHAQMEKEAERYYDNAQNAHAAAPDTGESHVGDDDDMEQLRRHFDDGDTDRFVALAHSLHEKLPEGSAEWHEVAQLGRQLLPGSPLFAESALAQTGGHHPDDFFFDEEGGLKHDPMSHEAPNAHDEHLRSMLDEPLEFEPRTEHTHESNELADLEFEREFGKHVGIEPEAPVKDHIEPVRDEEPEEAPVSLLDEDTVGTRLDLARAYLDMGDPEGARSMLDEVLAEGNDVQKDEARKLLAEIR